MTGNIPMAESEPLLRLWRWLHLRRNMRSVLAPLEPKKDEHLHRVLTIELMVRGLL